MRLKISHKRVLAWCIAGAVVLLLVLNVSVDCSLDAGGCLSVSFDKWAMTTADRLVVFNGQKEITITDRDFLRHFGKEVASGSHKDYCCAEEEGAWAELYKGDRMICRLRYIPNHDAFAYEADLCHWVLFGAEGHSFLSDELRQNLNTYYKKN